MYVNYSHKVKPISRNHIISDIKLLIVNSWHPKILVQIQTASTKEENQVQLNNKIKIK